jgi:hypothetical protein
MSTMVMEMVSAGKERAVIFQKERVIVFQQVPSFSLQGKEGDCQEDNCFAGFGLADE